MNKAVEFVAEHVMRFKRGHCQGTYGGGNINMDGCETWTWCDWCGYEIRDGATRPCPRFPFAHFSMRDLMTRLGEMGHHTMIRFDPERNEHKFTVCIGAQRVDDTDEPLEALCEYIARGHLEPALSL